MALYWCGSRGRWWFQLIHEMDDVCRRHGIEAKFVEMNAAPIKLYGDNDAATVAAKEIRPSAKSRHTRLKYHMIREICDEVKGECQTIRVPSADNIADCHSKAASVSIWNVLTPKMSGYDQLFPYTNDYIPHSGKSCKI